MATTSSRRRLPPRPLWVTEASTGTNHLVTEAAFVDGMQTSGVYQGLCGNAFRAAPMIEAPRGTCTACLAIVTPARTRCGRERGFSWWRHLRRRVQPKPVTR